MLTQRRSRRFTRVFNGLLTAMMVLSFTVAGLAQQQADETATTGVFIPYLVRDASYQESIGVLDTSFSDDGWLLTNYSGSLDDGYAIVIQPDGKLVMAGSFDGTSQDFGLARFYSDGSEDMTFDGDGRAHTDFFGNGDQANAVALQSDGKILVAGSAYRNITTKDEFALARYNSDGSMDNSFDGDGLVTTDFLGSADYATAVAIQNDGKIVVAGYAYDKDNFDYEFALARYTSSGALDTTFGTGGKVITDFNNQSDYAYALILSGDKVIVVGAARSGDYEFAVARYNANGTLDTTFDSDGKLVTDFAGFEDRARAVVLQPDGKLVIAGYSRDVYSNDFALARYNANGSLDATFDWTNTS